MGFMFNRINQEVIFGDIVEKLGVDVKIFLNVILKSIRLNIFDIGKLFLRLKRDSLEKEFSDDDIFFDGFNYLGDKVEFFVIFDLEDLDSEIDGLKVGCVVM